MSATQPPTAPAAEQPAAPGRSRAAITALAPFLPAAGALCAAVAALATDGGYYPRNYLPIGLALVALLAVAMFAGGRALPPRGAGRAPLILFVAGVGWSLASMLWTGSSASTFDAVAKLIVLLAVAWLVVLAPWRPRSAAVFIGAWAFAAAAACAIALVAAIAGGDAAVSLPGGRFIEPIAYTNGTAALGVMIFLPALALGSRREIPAVLQGGLLAVACFALQFALLPQTRAAIVGGAIGLLVLVAVAPQRLALLARLVLVLAGTALGAGPVFEVYEAASGGGDVIDALRGAGIAMAFAAVVVGAGGVGLALTEREIVERPAVARRARRAGIYAVVAFAVLFAGAAIASRGAIEDRWETATQGDVGDGESRISSLDPEERLDYMRVAFDMFRSAPVVGEGAGSFERVYATEREEPKPSRFTHNVFLRVLGETGIVGMALFLGFLATALVAAWHARRRSPPLGQAAIAGALALGAYFLAHASLDWVDEIPALAAPAVALTMIAARLGASADAESERGRGPWLELAAGGVAVALAGLILAVAWLGVRYTDRGIERLASDPSAAFADFDRAADIQPWSARPLLSKGVAAIQVEDPALAREAFRAALEREDSAFAHLELALLASQRSARRQAEREIDLALALEPRDVFLREARRRIRRGATLDPAAFNRELLQVGRDRFTRPKI